MTKPKSRALRRFVEDLEPRTLLAGNGLSASYYNNIDFTGASVSRVDATVNFDWKGLSPASGIAGDTFSVRWTGQIVPRYSQEYTFSTVSDDGVRLWVNGKQIINKWSNHPPETDRANVTLVAGQKYDIKLEYYQNYGGSVAALWWNSASQKGEIIPQAQMYSTTGGTTTTPPPVTPPPVTPPTVSPALKVSSNGRYLTKADGSPFFYLADTAWQMTVKLNRADVDYYFADRAGKGFNVVQIVAVDETYKTKNQYGQTPFVNNNPATINGAFFDQMDYIVNKARSYGMYVAMIPTWGRNVADPNLRIFNTTTAYNYGKFLGTRYRNSPNIIWMNGGDWAVSDATTKAIWQSLAKGLGDGDGGGHLMTFHPRGNAASRTYWSNESWLDFDMIQSGHTRDSGSYNLVTAEYIKSPVMPVIEGEPNYEDIPAGPVSGSTTGPLLDAYDVRKKAYWDIFAGAAGTAYGSNEVYQFSPGGGSQLNWKTALNLPGASDVVLLKKLMESRAYLTRVPDQTIVTSATLSGTDHIQATRDANGSFAMVYSASGKAFTVNMTKVTGTTAVNASWFDPRTGQVTAIGRFANTGTRTFTPPSAGYGQDWVLILDRA